MADQINIEKIAADNPNIDLQKLKEGQELLRDLQKTGSVTRSTYSLDTPESKREIRPAGGHDSPDCLSAYRRLR